MMENVDRMGQEEFIWAMRHRNLVIEEEPEDWKDRKISTTGSMSFTETSLSRSKSKSLEFDEVDNKARILATLVPDEIIYNCNDYNLRVFDACIMYGKINGIAQLVENHIKIRSGGQLTSIIGSYLTSIIQEVITFEGDVISFTGESFVIIWKEVEHGQSMKDCAHRAVDCALMIQKRHACEEIEQGVFVRTTMALSAGKTYFSTIGDEKATNFILLGNPAVDLKPAESIAQRGEIITCMSVWDYLDRSEYMVEEAEQKSYLKVFGVNQTWKTAQKSLAREEYRPEVELDENSINSHDGIFTDSKNEIFEMRQGIREAMNSDLKDDLKKFIITPVLRVIDMNESVEYLTEIRDILVLFINITDEIMEIEDYVALVDRCYQTICKIVLRLEGCITRVILLNGDIMFLVVFGLKGFKHELETQRGLKCAMEIYETLKRTHVSKLVSIGVTIGTAYCGMVGHILRREFSVLGATVTKAARLMKAYPDRVTCDRETFLQSKLEARYFILQEVKNIKDFKKIGPVYEFINIENDNYLTKYPISKYPILDRDLEINTYQKLLEVLINATIERRSISYVQTCLIIYGQSRQGKTRLAQEIIFSTPRFIPVFHISLKSSDKNIPYETIFLIFATPLGLNENGNSTREREAKLSNYLTKTTTNTNLFCVLNEVFKVNFPKPDHLLNLRKEKKISAMKKLIRQLCRACFQTIWTIVIDNGEFIDNESWPLLTEIFDTKAVFIVITIDSSVYSPVCSKYSLEEFVTELVLKPIDKWFHVGLACQFLDVKGIPPELEKVIHNKSNGNPGWIQSYLISLKQGNELVIKNVWFDQIDWYGLVLPTMEMITRGKADTEEDNKETYLKYNIDKELTSVLNEKWKIYRYSFNDSTTKLACHSSFYLENFNSFVQQESSDLGRQKSSQGTQFSHDVDICLLAANAEIDEVQSELSLNEIIMRIFDSLTSFEQILLKCGSVIGETIQRDMLAYILYPRKERIFASAVCKLFDVGLLKCAEANIAKSEYKIRGQSQRYSIKEDIDAPACNCIALVIPDVCKDLPKYANCNIMKFKIPPFKEVTYNLLTANQKKDFHSKAVRYLEKKTRKCQSCGGGIFPKILGVRHEMNIIKNKSNSPEPKSSSHILEDQDFYFERNSSLRNHSSIILEPQNQSIFSNKRSKLWKSSSIDSSSGEVERLTLKVQRFYSGNDLLRRFSNNDFSNCECPEILSNMYKQLIEHTEATDQIEKCMNAMLEYAVVLIETYNIPLALKILSKSLTMLEEKHETFIKTGENWKKEFIKAKTLTLLGRCRFELGQFKFALEIYDNAIKSYGYTLPNVNSFRARVMKFSLNLMLNSCMRSRIGSKVGYDAEFCDDVSELLSLMTTLFIELEMYECAEISAIWSLKNSLKSEKDFATLITAFSCVILAMIRNRISEGIIKFEVKSLIYVTSYRGQIDSRDLKAVMYLYATIFEARIIRGDIIKGIDIGSIILKIATSLNIKYAIQDIHPSLVRIFILTNRLMEGIQVIFDYEQMSIIESDYSGITWFYALCICVHLDTGYCVIPFQTCENYYYTGAKNLTSRKDLNALRIYLVALWVWHLRTENFEDAEIWEEKLRKINVDNKYENLITLYTNLYYLEGLILLAIYDMNRKNTFIADEIFEEIKQVMAKLSEHAIFFKIIYPKLLLLRAFYYMIIQEETDAFMMLNQARKHAIALGDIYDENLIVHTELAWKHQLTSIEEYFWIEHARENQIDVRDFEANEGKIGYYTYKAPLYY